VAKKKTAGPDSTTGATPAAAPKRRTTTKRTDTAAAQASAIAEAYDAGGSARSGNGHAASAPSYEEIAEAAYQRYLSRGGDHGRDFDDWVEAERELRDRR